MSGYFSFNNIYVNSSGLEVLKVLFFLLVSLRLLIISLLDNLSICDCNLAILVTPYFSKQDCLILFFIYSDLYELSTPYFSKQVCLYLFLTSSDFAGLSTPYLSK